MSDQPAPLLRQAAEKLRATAKHATPGPWTVHEAQGGFLRVEGTGDYSGYCEGADLHLSNRGTADWIALASPGLAGPLAFWLDDTAEFLEGVEITHGFVTELALENSRHALAVARIILSREAS
jgi:hypothetical protein